MKQLVDNEAVVPPQPGGDTTFVAGVSADRRGIARTGTDQEFLAPGTQLHEYRIERVLGHGGFGITYLARDTHLDKPVAIKEYLPAHLAVRNKTDVSARSPNEQRAFDWGRKQFLKEAQILARFTHPNLVPVHRFFQAHATAYFVMSYVEGETLAARLKRDPTPSEEFLRSVLLPILSGLKVVHSAGFLHRDIKPENILLQQDDTPVLIDFGAARVNLDSVTRSTMCALTAGYAPIEQYGSAGHPGPWTDIYAIGAVAYRAVTGRKPLEAVNRIHDDPLVPTRTLGKGRYSEAFLEAVDWAVAVHPEDRPRAVVDLCRALAGQGRSPTVVPMTPTPRVLEPVPVEPRAAKTGFVFPWATAASPLLALGLGAALFSGLRDRSDVEASPAAPVQMALPLATRPALREVAEPEMAVREPMPAKRPAAVKVASAAPVKTFATRPEARSALKAIAHMESLSSFQDCADCPAMAVLPKIAAGEAFAIGRFEVTATQYQECVGAGACRKPLLAPAAGNLPVVNVSFDDAQAYATWLSRTTGRRYRLPSDTEWEYAARSGTREGRFWSAGRPSCQYANAADSVACRDGHAQLAAVGSFKPNWFDLHDTAGNAWELTADCWRESVTAAPACTQRAARGGSWRTPAEALRSASRTPVATAHRSDTLGFRVVAE